jgi:hypothetical protein
MKKYYLKSGKLIMVGFAIVGLRLLLENNRLQNNEIREKIAKEHLKINETDFKNFIVNQERDNKKEQIYRVTPITNPLNATFKDTVGKHSENIPYEFILTKDALFLFQDKNSKLSMKLIKILDKRSLIDSTLFNYGRKGSEVIKMTDDTLYFEGEPIKNYVLDENIKAYFYKVDTLEKKVEVKFWKKI